MEEIAAEFVPIKPILYDPFDKSSDSVKRSLFIVNSDSKHICAFHALTAQSNVIILCELIKRICVILSAKKDNTVNSSVKSIFICLVSAVEVE